MRGYIGVSSIEQSAGHAGVLEDPDYGTVFQIPMNGNWNYVIANGLTTTACRDFVFFGHGSPNVLGSANYKEGLSSIALNLANSYKPTTGSSKPIPNGHPYRFVFLDGCDTAEGNWPLGFGIPLEEGMTINDFVNKRGIRPRAFMGWNRKKVLTWIGSGEMNDDHATS